MIKKQEFDYFLNKNKIDITLVTETWLHSYTNNYYNYDINSLQFSMHCVGRLGNHCE